MTLLIAILAEHIAFFVIVQTLAQNVIMDTSLMPVVFAKPAQMESTIKTDKIVLPAQLVCGVVTN